MNKLAISKEKFDSLKYACDKKIMLFIKVNKR